MSDPFRRGDFRSGGSGYPVVARLLNGGATIGTPAEPEAAILYDPDVDALVAYLRPELISELETFRAEAEARRPIAVGDRVEVTRPAHGLVGEVLELYVGNSPLLGPHTPFAAIRLDTAPEGSSHYRSLPVRYLAKEPSA